LLILIAIGVALFWAGYSHFFYPAYQPLSQTISELGQPKSPIGRQVAWGYFLPVSILLFTELIFVWQTGAFPVWVLAFLALTPLSYLVAAVFPCDEGAPLRGSFKNNVHMISGIAEYLGAMLGLSSAALLLPAGSVSFFLAAASLTVTAGLIGLVIPLLNRFKGAIQRVMELSIFLGLFVISCYS
jgi:hypothetical protein